MMSALLVVLLSLVSVSFAQRAEIVGEILPEVKRVNTIGYLHCSVVNIDDSEKVHWAKHAKAVGNYQMITISDGDKVTLQHSVEKGKKEDSGKPKYDIVVTEYDKRTTFTLVIRYLQEEDAGVYECYVSIQSLNDAKWPRKKGYLVVQVAPTIQKGDNSVYEAVGGGSISLKCDAYGNPKPNITWKRENGYPLPTGGFQFNGKVLLLENLKKEDRGNYICVADNTVKPPADYTVQIKIFYSPICKAVQRTVGQAQNRRFNAKLECIVSGHPEPSMQWEKWENGKRKVINDDSSYATEKLASSRNILSNTWYVLKVKNVQANDYTTYYCVARNKYGISEISFELFETMECQGPNCPSLKISGTGKLLMSTTILPMSLMSLCSIKFLLF